jgi:hypothetical protein
MSAFFGIVGLVVIAAAVVYFYKHPSKRGAKPTEGIDLANQGQNHNPGDGPKGPNP